MQVERMLVEEEVEVVGIVVFELKDEGRREHWQVRKEVEEGPNDLSIVLRPFDQGEVVTHGIPDASGECEPDSSDAKQVRSNSLYHRNDPLDACHCPGLKALHPAKRQ
jgi:hypothetical protein